jgi:hypothetical protein
MTLSKLGNSGLGAAKIRFEPEFTKWSEIHSSDHDKASDVWFGENTVVPISKYLSDRGETTSTLSTIRHWLTRFFEPTEVNVPPKLIIDIDILGDPIPLDESALGKTIIAELAKQKLNWGFAPAVSDYLSDVDLGNPDATNTDEIMLWETYDEQISSFASIKIFKNKRGKETPLIFSPMLVGSRPMHHITQWWVRNSRTNDVEFDQVPPLELGKVLNIGEWSEQIAQLPLLKRLFCEGEREGSEVASREEVFKHLAKSELPTPVVFHKVNQRVTGTWQSDNGDLVTSSEIFPHVVFAGWKLNDSATNNIGKTLLILTAAVKRMHLILSDGYESHKTGFADTSWDLATLAPAIMLADSDPGDRNGSGFWVPSVWAPLISAQTRGLNARSHDPSISAEDRRIATEAAVNFGMGFSALSAVNTLVFSTLIKERSFELADRILELAWLTNAPDESTNALSNWGVCFYVRNDFDTARSKFTEVLKREDHFSDSEAYVYLAEIARAEGNEALYAELRQKCEDSGGYSSAIFERLEVAEVGVPVPGNQPLPPLTKSSDMAVETPSFSEDSTDRSARAKFCTQCGTAFGNNEAKFCTQCGSSRA